MTVGDAFRELGTRLDEVARAGSVRSVDLVDGPESNGTTLTAEVELTACVDSTASPEADVSLVPADATVATDGRLRLAFESTGALVPTTDHDVTVEPTTVTVGDDGSVAVVLSVSARVADEHTKEGRRTDGATDSSGDARPTARDDTRGKTGAEQASPTADRSVRTTGATTRSPDDTGGVGGDSATTDATESKRDRSVPPFRDPDLLESVYESHDTFAEMADALDMDVTAETVRRYMIDCDVHQPNSYDTGPAAEDETRDDTDPGAETESDVETGSDGETKREAAVDATADTNAGVATGGQSDGTTNSHATADRRRSGGPAVDESPVALADGIGLPNDVTVERFVETVKRSNTIYEIKRDLGVDHDDALGMLRELNLLDLVVGRLATEAERDISRDDVVERLREASSAS
jgi:hypothetical protein